MDIPAPSLRKINSTGTRVPRTTGLPSIIFGFDSMRSWGMMISGAIQGTDQVSEYPLSFRDGPKDQTRNLEIPGSMLRIAPE